LRRYKLTPQLSEAEFSHWLVPRKGVIYTYVVEEAGEDGEKEVTDMFSFYSLPSSVLKHEKHTKLHAAYCYYYFANKTPVQQLISDALVLAKRHEFDVFNALDILDNDSLLKASPPTRAPDTHLSPPLSPPRPPARGASQTAAPLLPGGGGPSSSPSAAGLPPPPRRRSSSSASEMGTCSTTCTTGGAPRSWPGRLASSSSEAPTACTRRTE